MKKRLIIIIYICLILTILFVYPIFGFNNFIENNHSVQGDWTRVVIDSNAGGPHNIIVENVDNDNKPDLLVDAYKYYIQIALDSGFENIIEENIVTVRVYSQGGIASPETILELKNASGEPVARAAVIANNVCTAYR